MVVWNSCIATFCRYTDACLRCFMNKGGCLTYLYGVCCILKQSKSLLRFIKKTRMQSSRMRIARNSSRHGGLCTPTPPRADPLWSRHPPEQAPPSQIPLNFPLWCGPGNLQCMLGYHPLPPLEQAPPGQIPLNFPLGCGPTNLQGMLGYHPPETWCKACWDTTPLPPREQNHRRLWKYNLAPTSLRAVIKCRMMIVMDYFRV